MDHELIERIIQRYAPIKPVFSLHDILAHQAENVFELWKALESEAGREQEVPFWASVWPGAIALAGFLLSNKIFVEGKKVLDLGCGSGIAAIAAKKAGATDVVLNDIDPAALHMARMNAALNNVYVSYDATNRLEHRGTPSPVDTILVADMFYTRSQSLLLESYLREKSAQGSTILIADSHRPFAPSKGMDVVYTTTLPVDKDLEGTDTRNVRILTFSGLYQRRTLPVKNG